MTLSLYDVPIGSRFYITTEESNLTKRIDNLSFYIDLITLKRNKSRIESNIKAKNLDSKVPWRLRFLSHFSRIEGGRFRPDYGDLTLSRIPVSGMNIEFTHKVFYAAFATGRVKRQIEGDNVLNSSYKQKLIFGKMGFGEKRKTHFYLTYMQIQDKVPTEPQYSERIDSTKNAQSNVVIGGEFRLSLIPQKWTIDGEGGVALHTRDTRIEQSFDSLDIKVPNFLYEVVKPNISSSYDFAYAFSTRVNLPTTTIRGGYRWVGPGYHTLGNPILLNDRQSFEGRIDQVFLKRRIYISAYYKRYNDNLRSNKLGTSTGNAFGIIARLTFRKIPYIQISFTPNRQEINNDTLSIWNSLNVFSVSTGYNHQFKEFRSFTSLNYNIQSTDYEYSTTAKYGVNHSISLNQVVMLKIPLQFNFSTSYTNLSHTDINTKVFSIAVGGNHIYKERWKNTLSIKYMRSQRELLSEYGVNRDRKISLYWETQYVNLWDIGDVTLSFTDNIFRNSKSFNFNEIIIQGKLAIKW